MTKWTKAKYPVMNVVHIGTACLLQEFLLPDIDQILNLPWCQRAAQSHCHENQQEDKNSHLHITQLSKLHQASASEIPALALARQANGQAVGTTLPELF
jgi:hypothetical protein